jgi:hypothetical protein
MVGIGRTQKVRVRASFGYASGDDHVVYTMSRSLTRHSAWFSVTFGVRVERAVACRYGNRTLPSSGPMCNGISCREQHDGVFQIMLVRPSSAAGLVFTYISAVLDFDRWSHVTARQRTGDCRCDCLADEDRERCLKCGFCVDDDEDEHNSCDAGASSEGTASNGSSRDWSKSLESESSPQL